MDEQAYRLILKRAGFVLVAVGLIDIGWMVYCIVNRISYSSSLNLFAVIAGVLLIRGGLRTAGIVRWLALFAVSALVTVAVVLPFSQPIGLSLAETRFHTMSVVTSIVVMVALAAALYWSQENSDENRFKSRGIPPVSNDVVRVCPYWVASG